MRDYGGFRCSWLIAATPRPLFQPPGPARCKARRRTPLPGANQNSRAITTSPRVLSGPKKERHAPLITVRAAIAVRPRRFRLTRRCTAMLTRRLTGEMGWCQPSQTGKLAPFDLNARCQVFPEPGLHGSGQLRMH